MLKIDKNGACWKVTVNRPEKLNALNNRCLKELDDVFENIRQSGECRVVILTGEGPKAFVAGADIREWVGMDSQAAEKSSREGQRVFRHIETCGKAVIAAVNGFALGGGLELAMSASFRLASSNANFGFPEVSLGLIPGYGGTQRLARLVGAGAAAQMIVTGDMIDAQQALSWGLVSEVHEPEKLMPRAEALAETIASRSPQAVNKALFSFYTGLEKGEKAGYETEAKMFGKCFESDDMREGTTAFLEKRKAEFKGL